MRRIVVHLIKGEAQAAHIAVTRDLTEKFDSFPLHNRIPVHFTLKRFFELEGEELEILYSTLSEYVKNQTQSDYTLSGYGHFDDRVIFMDAQPSLQMVKSLKELFALLHTVSKMMFDEYDDDLNLHATVAMAELKPFNFDQIWTYLHSDQSTQKLPNFAMKFDNIAVLKKVITPEWTRWEIDREFPIL